MTSLVTRFLKDESGATAIEYGLIAAGISIAIIATVGALGTSLNNVFKHVSDELAKSPGAGGGGAAAP
jgi:pilus assembly protein Flp/PilA